VKAGGAGLLGLLTEHGIQEKGARVYLAACREGPQTASELARISALNRVDAYRFIRQLEEGGLLRSDGGRPRRFAAIPPEELIELWIRRASDKLHRLEHGKGKILADLKQSLTRLDDHDTRKFAVLEGREAVSRFVGKKIGMAQKQVLLSTSGLLLASLMDGGVDRKLKEAKGRGVKIRVVSEITRANLGEAKHFASFAELRHAAFPVTNRAVVVDRMGALVFVSGEDGLGRTGDEQVALWTSAPTFLELAHDYHRRLWTTAIRADARFVELEEGERAVLPVIVGREAEPFQRLREVTTLGMRATGIRELRLNLPELIEAVASQLGRQVARQVEGRTPGEVAKSLSEFYESHAMGRLNVVKEKPLVLRVSGCFACTSSSPEVGRVMCPKLLRTVLETRLGTRWEVSKPDPTHHASRGCLFSLTPA